VQLGAAGGRAGDAVPVVSAQPDDPGSDAAGESAGVAQDRDRQRRILYTLARLGLSPLTKNQDAVNGLAFDFLRPTESAPVLNEVVASLGHPTFYPFVFSESIIRKFFFVHHMVRFFGTNPADAVQPPVAAAPEPVTA